MAILDARDPRSAPLSRLLRWNWQLALVWLGNGLLWWGAVSLIRALWTWLT